MSDTVVDFGSPQKSPPRAEAARPAGEQTDARASSAASVTKDKAPDHAALTSNIDTESVSRGIQYLDKLMAHLGQTYENNKKTLSADEEELKWLNQEIAVTEPKKTALVERLEEKRAQRAELSKSITEFSQNFHSIAQQTQNILRNASKRNRSITRANATDVLEDARGFSSKVSTRDIIAGHGTRRIVSQTS